MKRVLIKLSGESLSGPSSCGIDPERLQYYAEEIRSVSETGIETAIVIGGGNIFRGYRGSQEGLDRYTGDQMGMLATVINGLAIQSSLQNIQVKARVFTAISMSPVGELYSKPKVMEALQEGFVSILCFGTGNPYFTTDTAAALRAVEISADALLKGTRVDGVYSDDPEKNPEARKYSSLTFSEAYQKNLRIMDLTAFTLCRENNLPVIVFDINTPGNLKRIILGENIGTVVKN